MSELLCTPVNMSSRLSGGLDKVPRPSGQDLVEGPACTELGGLTDAGWLPRDCVSYRSMPPLAALARRRRP